MPDDEAPSPESDTGDRPEAEGGSTPESPLASDDPLVENSEGAPPPDAVLEAAGALPRQDQGWGELPRRVQDVFQSESRSEMPTRYRSWIDAYYRRLNERSAPR